MKHGPNVPGECPELHAASHTSANQWANKLEMHVRTHIHTFFFFCYLLSLCGVLCKVFGCDKVESYPRDGPMGAAAGNLFIIIIFLLTSCSPLARWPSATGRPPCNVCSCGASWLVSSVLNGKKDFWLSRGSWRWLGYKANLAEKHKN